MRYSPPAAGADDYHMPRTPSHALLAACAALVLAMPPWVVAQPAGAPAAAPAANAPFVVGQMPLLVDAHGRLQAQVTLDGKGPLRFTLDTAASGFVLAQATADRLHLRAGAARAVVGGIGRGQPQSVQVQRLRTDLFDVEDAALALLPGVAGDGILGMAPFLHGRIEFDLANHRLLAGPSGPTPAGFAAIAGSLHHGLLVVPVRIDGVDAQALVDTGTPLTIANPRLQAALGLLPGDARLSPGGIFTDAFGQPRNVEQATLGHLRLGEIAFSQPTLRFADMPVLRALGLDDGPALILGIGQLAQMGAIAIDFPRAQLQLRP